MAIIIIRPHPGYIKFIFMGHEMKKENFNFNLKINKIKICSVSNNKVINENLNVETKNKSISIH